jgi:hypothetical protein
MLHIMYHLINKNKNSDSNTNNEILEIQNFFVPQQGRSYNLHPILHFTYSPVKYIQILGIKLSSLKVTG